MRCAGCQSRHFQSGRSKLGYGSRVRSLITSFFAPPLTADSSGGLAKLMWVVRLRWVALSAQALSVFPALAFGLLEIRSLAAFLGIIASLAVLNFITWRALLDSVPVISGRFVLLAQLTLDIAALSALLALTGGARNPMLPLLFVHAGIGALLLRRRQSSLFFALLIGFLILLQLFSHIPPGLENVSVPVAILFPAQVLVALVFWILTIWLSTTLDSLRDESTRVREQQTRIDRLRAVGALAAGLSHEFATPLNTAQLRLARLGRREELDSNTDFVAAVESLDRCHEILRRMAGAPLRPEALDLGATDVDELVERVCSSVSHANPEISIRITLRGNAPYRAQLPVVAFSQVLLNLIDNAIESAGNEEEIEVVVEGNREGVDVSVLDRGSGWPDTVRSHLGQPFITTKSGGVGLGLYYVHTLIEAIGGSFHLEDRSEGGAIARITLKRSTPERVGA